MLDYGEKSRINSSKAIYYCRSLGEGVGSLDQGSRGGEDDLSISHLPCRLQGLCGSGKAKMCLLFQMTTIYRDRRVFFTAFSPPSQPLILELEKENSVLGT